MSKDKRKNPPAQESDFQEQLREYVRKIGSLGGKKRKENLSPERRSEIARKAVLTRWAKAKRRKKSAK